jgi:hypothetical protein
LNAECAISDVLEESLRIIRLEMLTAMGWAEALARQTS